mgnify:FL=1
MKRDLPRDVRLLALYGSRRGQDFPVPADGLLIGREPHVDLQLEEHGVSREHARVGWSDEGELQLEDLDSTNGVLHNGNTVDGRVTLKHADQIALGETLFEVYDARAAASRRAWRTRGLALILLALMFLVPAEAMWFLRARRPQPQESLRISSVPAGATVYNGGRAVGVTPFEHPAAAGEYHFVLRLEGYDDLHVTTSVPQDETIPLCELAPSTGAEGSLRVTTVPAGGMVYIDGRARGRTPPALDEAGNPAGESPPLIVSELAPGTEHEAWFELEGRRSRTYRFTTAAPTLRMRLWRPDVVVESRDGSRLLAMLCRKTADGALVLAPAPGEELTLQAPEVKDVRYIEPMFPE